MKVKINPKKMLKEHKSYMDSIQEELEEQGIDFFSPSDVGGTLNIDKEYLVLPPNITEVSPKDLGEYLNAFTQQKMYMRTLLGYAELLCEECCRKYDEVSASKYKELLNSKLSETSKEREVNSDPNVLPVFNEYMDCKRKVRLINLNIASIEDAIFLISREVSRRTGDFNEENRNYNVQRR